MKKTVGAFTLEKLTPENINELGNIDFSKEMMQYITGKPLSFEEASLRYTRDIEHPYFGSYFIKSAGNGEIVGFSVIKMNPMEAEIGYLVLGPFRRNGLATRINRKLIEICSKKLPGYTIVAYTDKRNTASIRVLEKSGMRKMDTKNVNGVIQLKYQFK